MPGNDGTSRMKLFLDPSDSLPLFSMDLQLVIRIEEGRSPELFLEHGISNPDRHLLLGLVQRIAMAVEERDRESVAFANGCTIRLKRAGEAKTFGPGLVIARSDDGTIGAVASVDPSMARRLARLAVRWFTGTIRLDVP
jgi:hypothetical protein